VFGVVSLKPFIHEIEQKVERKKPKKLKRKPSYWKKRVVIEAALKKGSRAIGRKRIKEKNTNV